MKKLIKAVLPKPILHAALDLRDAGRLACGKKQIFTPDNLLQTGTVNLDLVFNSKTLAKDWDQDNKAISDLFGDNDRFGGINHGDRRALYYLIRALRPRSVLEVGTHIGASTLYIARALAGNGGGTVTTSLNFMKETEKKFDFIFLDGDHAAGTVYREVAHALRILSPGGVVLLHDFYPEGRALFPDDNIIHGPFRALARIARENPDITVQPLGNLPWETKQGVHTTSLALLEKTI